HAAAVHTDVGDVHATRYIQHKNKVVHVSRKCHRRINEREQQKDRCWQHQVQAFASRHSHGKGLRTWMPAAARGLCSVFRSSWTSSSSVSGATRNASSRLYFADQSCVSSRSSSR